MEKAIEIMQSGNRIVFTPESNGIPAYITVKEFDQERIIAPEGFRLFMDVENIGRITPSAAGCAPEHYTQNGADVVEFANLHWQDSCGNPVPDFNLALRYEFFPDGVSFCTAVFHGETAHPPKCGNFCLEMPLEFESFDDCRFAVFPRMLSTSAADIQSTTPKRFIESGTRLDFPRNLPQTFGFNLFREQGPDLYAELFLESGAALSGKMEDTFSDLTWHGKNPVVRWCFQKTMLVKDHRPLQWRNRWGWNFAPPAVVRRVPPQHCYQFIDNYRHYPTADELETIRKSGCTMLIIHSNWRRDAADGSVPYDRKRLAEIIEFTGKNNIALLLYMRGNEKEIVENGASWFSRILDKNKDGLYMDYAGPSGRIHPPEEFYPGGTVEFYDHYLTLKRIRENLGDNGILIGHTGAFFSSLGISFSDAYISGEGERGQLLSGRKEYNYFIMSAAAPGSLWSAAFPEYATSAVIPFIASAGQFPHSPLGMQFASSSLLHPPEPGINDTVFRPLWKIWKTFAHERNVSVYSDYNSCGIFGGSEKIGHYLMISADRKRALLVLSDFGGKGNVSVNWEKISFSIKSKKVFHLTPNETSPGTAVETDVITAEFTEYPAEAYYFTDCDIPDGFAEPYEQCGQSGKAFEAGIKSQREMRTVPATEKAVLQIYLDDRICTALEDSMVYDIYDATIRLGRMDKNGFNMLGIITPDEFLPGVSDRNDTPRLMPGDASKEIDLVKLLGKGTHKLAVKSFYQGLPFYNFVTVRLYCDDGYRELEFRNQLETDRSQITFEITIK